MWCFLACGSERSATDDLGFPDRCTRGRGFPGWIFAGCLLFAVVFRAVKVPV